MNRVEELTGIEIDRKGIRLEREFYGLSFGLENRGLKESVGVSDSRGHFRLFFY